MCDAPALPHPTHCTNQLALQYSPLCTSQNSIAATDTQTNRILCSATILITTSGGTQLNPATCIQAAAAKHRCATCAHAFFPTPAKYRRTKLSTHRLHQAFLPPMPTFHILISPCCGASSKPTHCYLPFPNTNVFCSRGNQADAETIPRRCAIL